MVKIAMNGGRSKKCCPSVPVSVSDYAKEIKWFLQQGVNHFHIHFRDDAGNETLDQTIIEPQFKALKDMYPDAMIGIGSPLQNGMTAEKRKRLVSDWFWKPDYISLNVCEKGSCELSEILWRKQVPIEYGIFTIQDVETFEEAGYAETARRILIEVSGEDSDDATVKKADQIYRRLSKKYPDAEYLLHGEDIYTWAVIRYAKENGLNWRIGFEDIDCFEDGTSAKSNMDLFLHASIR